MTDVLTAPAPAPPEVSSPAPSRPPWRSALLAAAVVWSAATVMHLAVTMLAWLSRGPGPSPSWTSLILGWNRWDAGHYVRIAEEGYHLGPGFPAFFPLYPMLIRVFDPVLPGGGMASALVVANAAAFGALALLHRLAQHEFGPEVAQRATGYLAALPMSFFLFIGYNESLFLLLAIGALYAGRRGHWWLAGALGALASATRMFGLLLMLPLAIEYLRRCEWRPRRIRPDVLALALVPLGVVAYGVYCWRELGDPLAFSTAQHQWGRAYTFPGQALVIAVEQAAGRGLLDRRTLGAILDAGTVLVALVLLVLCVVGPFRFRRDQLYLVAYSAATLVLVTSTEVGGRAMQSSARYTLEAVAVVLVLARIGAHQVVDRLVLTGGVAMQVVLLIVFTAGTFLVG